jgi:histidyl-tRNA synthetase
MNSTPQPAAARPDVFLVHLGPEAQEKALLLSQELRQAGLAVDQSYDTRSLSSQLKIANRKNARYTVIIGENELRRGVAMVREMALGQQTEVTLTSLLAHLRTKG